MTIEEAKRLILNWNAQKGTSSRTMNGTEPNNLTLGIKHIADRFGDDVCYAWFKKKMSDPNTRLIGDHVFIGSELLALAEEMKEETPAPTPTTPVVEEKPVQAQTTPVIDGGSVLKVLSQELLTLIGSQLAENIEAKVNQFVADKTLVKIVSIDGIEKKPVEGITHKKFESVLQFVSLNIPVMLVGPAGSGKNVIVEQVAKALDLDFYMSNKVTDEFKLTGFVDAMGNFSETPFYKFCKNGGIFFLDEADASDPNALTVLNSAIANRYFDFPKIGRVQLNKNCHFIAAANTFGTGASMQYSGRNQLDAATLNRFVTVYVDYDKRIEEACSRGNKEALEFCREYRKASQKNGLQVVLSYRDITNLCFALEAGMDRTEAIADCIVKGLQADSLRMLKSSMSRIAWSDELDKVLKEIEEN